MNRWLADAVRGFGGAGMVNGPFPLPPALSLGERENGGSAAPARVIPLVGLTLIHFRSFGFSLGRRLRLHHLRRRLVPISLLNRNPSSHSKRFACHLQSRRGLAPFVFIQINEPNDLSHCLFIETGLHNF